METRATESHVLKPSRNGKGGTGLRHVPFHRSERNLSEAATAIDGATSRVQESGRRTNGRTVRGKVIVGANVVVPGLIRLRRGGACGQLRGSRTGIAYRGAGVRATPQMTWAFRTCRKDQRRTARDRCAARSCSEASRGPNRLRKRRSSESSLLAVRRKNRLPKLLCRLLAWSKRLRLKKKRTSIAAGSPRLPQRRAPP